MSGAEPAGRRPRLAERVAELLGFAADRLGEMQLDDGLFCHELVAAGERESGGRLGRGRRVAERQVRGCSVRYSLICLLGLQRAAAAGIAPIDPVALLDRLRELSPYAELSAGDAGLLLWAEARAGADPDPAALERLEAALAGNRPYALETHELCWAAVGCARAREAAAGVRESALERLTDELLGRLLARAETPSGLLLNSDGGRRSVLPHFASQIYGVHALAVLARATGEAAPLAAAQRIAQKLIALRGPDGAWPWIYDVRSGSVVEPYRLYSVHQDAMAPLAMFELALAGGDTDPALAAADGVEWVWGANELGVRMLDHEAGLIHRSINRRGAADRAALWANSASALARGRPLLGSTERLVVERTDRPYHLGWVFEAWAGRELAELGLDAR